MRVLGIDLGSRRIGIALSDPSGTLATPWGVLARSGDRGRDHAEVALILRREEVGAVVIGLPLSLSGGMGPAARAVAEEVEQLRALLPVPVHTCDERFTTVTATSALRRAGGGRPVRAAGRRRGEVDAAAAAVLLQAWLDRGHGRDQG